MKSPVEGDETQFIIGINALFIALSIIMLHFLWRI
jgi:hypothetical protein